MEITNEIIREIIKESLRFYHQNTYDKTIDGLIIERNDFRGNPTFQIVKEKTERNTLGKYFLFSLKDNKISINGNIIQTERYKLETGKEYDHGENRGKDLTGYNFDFNHGFKYETDFTKIIALLRDKRIDEILND